MALNLRRTKRFYLMPGKAREGGGSFTITSTNIGYQFLPHTSVNKRMFYLRYNATGARHMVTMLAIVEVQTKGSMKLQLLM